MSFYRWLHQISAALSPGRIHRKHVRRGARRIAFLESLENRWMLSFLPAGSLDVGTAPDAVVAADFNGDGHLDLATANAGSNNISVLLGNGAGGFGAAQPFGAGFPSYLHPDSLAVADFNGDAKLDLVAAGGVATYILKGNGDGTFQSAVRVGGLGFYTVLDVAAGDFNGDGKMDLVVTEQDDLTGIGGAVYVLLGNGQGGVMNVWYNGVYPRYGLAVADFNGDGNLDIATAGYVMLGNGNGTLREATEIFPFAGNPDDFPRTAAVGDLTGDGIADLVRAGYGVAVDRGLGDGTFTNVPPFSQPANGPFHTAVATADFNGDGKLDVVTTDSDADVWLGNGDGTLRYPLPFATGTGPASVAVGDFNRDGRPDVATANGTSNTVSVLLNDGDWPFQPPPPPWISISDATVTEGNTGTAGAVFTLTLSRTNGVDVTVHYATADVSATAGSDYAAGSGTVTIPAGQLSRTITVAVQGDRLAESTETFAVNLSAATNATIGDGQGIGTIVDNEPRISISDVSKAEGKKGRTTLFTFTVTLSAAYDQPVTMSYRTVDGTATAGNDFIAKTGTLTFAPGETTKTITIEVKGDSRREPNETFYLDLYDNNNNSAFAKQRGIGTILNDDPWF